MPLIKPGPGERWCPCCERLFVPTPGKRKSALCLRPDCVARQAAWAKARHLSLEGCPDCGGRRGAHEEGVCRRGILEKMGLPNGPCPWCKRTPGNHRDDCQLRRWHDQLNCPICGRRLDPSLPPSDPDAVTREHHIPKIAGGGNGPDNHKLSHQRCNRWKGSGSTAALQPLWGVRSGIPKSDRRPESATRVAAKTN